jgi:phage major head subunit gpT-like protein
MISDNWADALDPIVRFRFMQGFARRQALRETLFNVLPSQSAFERVSGVGALGIEAWNTYEKNRTVGQAKFDQGYKTTFQHRVYPMEVPIEKTLLTDSQWAEINNIAESIGDSASLKRETDAASIFNNAFSSDFVGGDNVPLCSNSHPLSPKKDSSTQDNNGALPLTKENVGDVRELMMAFTDDNGQKVAVTPNILLVGPGLEDEALEITKSLLDPNSANNKINPQAGRFSVVTWHYLTDSNAWFMIDSALMKRSLFWFDREPLTIKPKVEDKTVVATWIAHMRYSFGWGDWRWVYGNNPS